MTDQELTNAIHKTATRLNSLMDEAARQGLKVEMSVEDISQLGIPVPCSLIVLNVYKGLRPGEG